MRDVFLLTLAQIATLFVFLILGYVFKKKNIVGDGLSAIVGKLEVYVFLPALCFNTFAGSFHLDVLMEKGTFILVALAVMGVTFPLALFLAKRFTKNPATRGIYIYAFTIPNLGYLGYPLISAVYGEEMLLNYMIFAIPYNIFIYTAGRFILSENKRFTPKSLLEPSLVAVGLGMAAGLANIKMPAFAQSALDMARGCMAPMAMVMTGFVLARTPFKFNIANPKMYLASFLRLIAIPAAAGGIMLLLGLRGDVVLVAVALLCMPMGLNNVVFPEAYGGDSETGAQSCFVSHALGAVTIPIMFALLSAVVM